MILLERKAAAVLIMKYLLLKSDAEMYWFELNDDNYAARQIVIDEYNVIHVSCLEDCLAEGAVNETDIDESFQIVNLTKQEFDTEVIIHFVFIKQFAMK